MFYGGDAVITSSYIKRKGSKWKENDIAKID
jgi:hypothetical protein